jgi:20S proteasome alpha/beta subunit
MTLILAITCKDRVVLASDRLAINLITGEAIKSDSRKIFQFGRNRLWGCSGTERDIAQFQDTLSKILDETKNCPLTESRLKKRLEEFSPEPKVTPDGIRYPEYLVVGHEEYPMVWHMVNTGARVFLGKNHNELTDCDIFPIGSPAGQLVTRAFFKRIKDVCNEYTIKQGSLFAYRVIKQAIKESAYVGGPIEIWTISNNEVTPKSDAELKELERLLDEWEEKERRVSQDFLSSVN